LTGRRGPLPTLDWNASSFAGSPPATVRSFLTRIADAITSPAGTAERTD
jgi:hypothetical protein